MNSEKLQVVLTAGLEDGGRRAALGLGAALASVAHGHETYVFLSLDAAPMGTPTGCVGIIPRGFTESLDENIQTFMELGGIVEVCSSCYVEYCRHLPSDDEGHAHLREGVGIQGLSILVDRAAEMPVLTF